MSTASISTTAAKHGNVLVLLNTLYTSGFASVGATMPMLTSKTMHTLYASSFLIYSTNCMFNWFYTYCILNGYVTSFPLRMWFVIGVVIIAVSGSMLCVLLVMLCVENAFAHRLNITSYKSGLAVIWEAFLDWVHSFNNFRVAFLFMILHDAPITFSNFFLISACRCGGPHVLHWPLFISTMSTCVSLIWRLVMLYFAYRRLIFSSRPRVPVNDTAAGMPGELKKHSHSNSSFKSAGRYAVPVVSLNEGPRLKETDETWPIRWASINVYGEYPITKYGYETFLHPDLPTNCKHTMKEYCIYVVNIFIVKISNMTYKILRGVAFIMLVVGGYALCALCCCLPCLHFYMCRKNSFAHRHKCSKSCVRQCTLAFHYSALVFSVIFVLILLTLNVLLIDSVHIFGANNFPPEINTICLSVDLQHKFIRPFLRSASPYELWLQIWSRITSQYKIGNPKMENENSTHKRFLCKPIWENDWGENAGVYRKTAGPWQTRMPLPNRQLLAISTHFISDYRISDLPNEIFTNNGPTHTLLYDFALFTQLQPELRSTNGTEITGKNICSKRKQSQWNFVRSLEKLGFPYFVACTPSVSLQRADLIDCQ